MIQYRNSQLSINGFLDKYYYMANESISKAGELISGTITGAAKGVGTTISTISDASGLDNIQLAPGLDVEGFANSLKSAPDTGVGATLGKITGLDISQVLQVPSRAKIKNLIGSYLGGLQDSLSLRLAYSAANIMIVPSRIDAQPNTATEALACGTPVVAFRTSGMPELVDDERTGKLAEPFDIDSLASSLRWLLSDESRLTQLGLNARLRALRLWSYERIGKMYIEHYHQIQSHRVDEL